MGAKTAAGHTVAQAEDDDGNAFADHDPDKAAAAWRRIIDVFTAELG